MFESLKIGRPFGINLYLHGTFWLLPAFVLLSGLMSYGLEMALLDVGVLLTIFGCVALHELGHALAARGFGIGTKDIVLYPLGGVARLDRMPERPWQEIAVALAGPAVNVAIALLLAPLMMLDGYALTLIGPYETYGEAFWNRVLLGNIVLVLFNLIPAFPMDGGRVLRAALAMFTTRLGATAIAANVGAGFAILFGLLGLVSGNFMLMLLAFFLFVTGRAELAGVRHEEAERRYRDRYGDDGPTVSVFGRPVARPVNEPTARPADGWEYDPRRRVWVEWRDGYPVRVARAEE
jgi:Zn-dependent protease